MYKSPDSPEHLEFTLTCPYHLHLRGKKVDSAFSSTSIQYLDPLRDPTMMSSCHWNGVQEKHPDLSQRSQVSFLPDQIREGWDPVSIVSEVGITENNHKTCN